MKGSLIQASGLGVRYGNRYLLKDIDWRIERGEHWLVFGLNGSGKTTLVSILAGYGYFSEGTLSVFGSPYTEENVLAKRRRIGFVSGSFFDRVYHEESVLDIVLSGLTGSLTRDLTITDSQYQRAQTLLKGLGIPDKERLPFSTLSKGQRQNVLIARALIASPELLILDEPATGLDVYNRELLLSTISDLAEHTDMTILYITHYTEEILPQIDRTLLLKNGRCYRQGATAELFGSEAFSRFLDHPAVVGPDPSRMHVSLEVPAAIRRLITAAQGVK